MEEPSWAREKNKNSRTSFQSDFNLLSNDDSNEKNSYKKLGKLSVSEEDIEYLSNTVLQQDTALHTEQQLQSPALAPEDSNLDIETLLAYNNQVSFL